MQDEATAAEARKARLGAEVDAASARMRAEATQAQAKVESQEHISRSLEQHARSKGVEHEEVGVERALEGGAFDWRWSQTSDAVTLWVDIPRGTPASKVKCSIKASSLCLTVVGVEGALQGALFDSVCAADSMWTIGEWFTAAAHGSILWRMTNRCVFGGVCLLVRLFVCSFVCSFVHS